MDDASSSANETLGPDELTRLRPALVALVRRVVPRWLRDQADDIVQSAIAQVLERLQSKGGDFGVASSYLMRAAHNAAIDEIRRRMRRPEVSMDDDAGADAMETRTPGPNRMAESREIDRAIRSCLTTLAAPRRAAVMLFLYGYSLLETEAMSGWGRKRAEHLTYRGLSDMKRCLESKGVVP